MTTRSFLGFGLVALMVACADQPASESGSNSSELATAASTTYHCSLAAGSDGISEDNTITLDSSNEWMTIARRRMVNGAVTGTGTSKGYAVVSTGNMNHGFADQSLQTHMLGSAGLVTGLDGSNPRMLLPGATFIACSAQ